MSNIKILQKTVENLLKDNIKILESWREQEPTKQKDVKNFENWLLVELVHCLYNKKMASHIKTNGFLNEEDRKKLKGNTYELKRLLRGRKKNSHSLSPDLSFEGKKIGKWCIDIKTQLHFVDITDDLQVVNYFNSKKKTTCVAAFLWVIIIPQNRYKERVLKRVNKYVKKIGERGKELKLDIKGINKWLLYSLTSPGVK